MKKGDIMKNIFIFIVLASLFAMNATATFDVYTNTLVGTHNSTSSRITTAATVSVGVNYDSILQDSIDGSTGINTLFLFSVNDLNYTSWQNIAWVDVNCTYIDAQYDGNGNYQTQTVSSEFSERYTTVNTPSINEEIYFSLGRGDVAQCVLQAVYRVNSNITVEYPYAEQFILPMKTSNLEARAADYLKIKTEQIVLQQALNSQNVLQTYNNNISNHIYYIIRGVFELWLILLFAAKIGFVYFAFVLVVLAIAFPVLMLVKFRKKIRECLELEKEIR